MTPHLRSDSCLPTCGALENPILAFRLWGLCFWSVEVTQQRCADLRMAGKGDVESRAAPAAAVEPDPTAVYFGDLLDDGESNSRARSPILRRPETLECLEYLLVMFGVDPTAGVAHGDVAHISLIEDQNCNARLLAGSHVIDRVSDQI